MDGKLVPIESKPNPKMRGIKENETQFKDRENLVPTSKLYQHQEPPHSFPCNVDSMVPLSVSLKPLQRATMKGTRTALKGAANAALKSKLSFGNQLPLKRLSPYTVEHDDDFE